MLDGCPCGRGTAPLLCDLSSPIVSLLQLDGIGNFMDGETEAQGALDGSRLHGWSRGAWLSRWQGGVVVSLVPVPVLSWSALHMTQHSGAA